MLSINLQRKMSQSKITFRKYTYKSLDQWKMYVNNKLTRCYVEVFYIHSDTNIDKLKAVYEAHTGANIANFNTLFEAKEYLVKYYNASISQT
jgi:hypothetical protein